MIAGGGACREAEGRIAARRSLHGFDFRLRSSALVWIKMDQRFLVGGVSGDTIGAGPLVAELLVKTISTRVGYSLR